MRLSSFLPIFLLFLLASPLVAQQNCDISNLTVDVGVCHPNVGTYDLTVNFVVTNPGNGLFHLTTGNGADLGIFAIDSLPVLVNHFPWDGGLLDTLVVCMDNQANCCETIVFTAPNCVQQCSIVDLQVTPGDCASDSTYQAIVDFHLLSGVAIPDSFRLYLDDSLRGVFSLGQLPLPVFFETNDSAHAVVKVCVNLPSGAPCCLEQTIEVPACPPPCTLQNVQIQTDSCTSDSTFGVWVNFQVADSTAVDSFSVWGNGGHPLGHFGLNQLPLYISNYAWNGLIFNQIRVCAGNAAGCCKEVQFLAPGCLPFDSCAVTQVTVQTGACTSDSTYKLSLNFNATNPGNGTFIVWANGIVLDTFNLTQAPLTIPNFPWNGGANDVVTVCIGSDSIPAIGCCKTVEFAVPACLHVPLPCDITDLVVHTGDCTGDSTYAVTFNFQVANAPDSLFSVWANGHLFGQYLLDQLPVTISNFPWNGGANDVLRVCFDSTSNNTNALCCETVEFAVPNCLFPCEIVNLQVETGDCNPDSTYHLTLNFGVANSTATQFSVWGNGVFIGVFNLNQLPLHIAHFPWDGTGPNDGIRVCIGGNTGANTCCRSLEFPIPDCLTPPAPCDITDLVVHTGDCTGDSTYAVTFNFQVANAPDSLFNVWANGHLFGQYLLDQLPVTIPNFPWNGGANDVLRVCFDSTSNNTNALCCETVEFAVPNCLFPCEIVNLQVQTGDCNPDSTYHLTLNFGVANSTATQFSVWGNGVFIGVFNLNQLPLHIAHFPWDGTGPNDGIRVCIGGNTGANTCCRSLEFPIPDCLTPPAPCDITDLVVHTGDCTGDSTYAVTFNFQVANAPDSLFNVWANGHLFGQYLLDQLPVTIPNFPWNGGANDVLRVCFDNTSNNTNALCCETVEFAVPNCLFPCEIVNLQVETGDCNPDSTYHLTLNFGVANSTATQFSVWGNGVFIGVFNLNQLPLHIAHFPWDGTGPNDGIRVCIGGNTGANTCCRTLEFPIPDCLHAPLPCDITNLVVHTGDCTGDSTYAVTFNFQVANAPDSLFNVWANGHLFGQYLLDQLPVTIPNFPWDGGANDVLRVCFGNSPTNPTVLCCETVEFAVPGCLTPPGDCEIFGMVASTGDCTSDHTYVLNLNFQVANPPGNVFGVWANGVLFGTYNLSQLPLHINNFPWGGGVNDVVKVCFLTGGAATCCRTIAVVAPNCLGTCHIFDLSVQVGDCNPAGGYHVNVNFGVTNPGNDLFEVWANNQYLGAFPLNQLPLHIPNFPASGNPFDVIRVCIKDHPDCCVVKEIQAPVCDPCEIVNLHVDTGDCNADSTYHLTLNFGVANSTATEFVVWGNGVLIGVFNLNQLPLHIAHFPWDGTGPNDVIKVCIGGNTGANTCCRILEFPIPDCLHAPLPCDITNLVVHTGDCTSDSTYAVTFNFQVTNTQDSLFGVWANGQIVGIYLLDQLPVTIPNFPWDGGANDVLRVCFGNSPTNPTVLCCETVEFAVPGCLTLPGDCEIFGMVASTGDCTSDHTYVLNLNFQVANPPGNVFGVWANGVLFGTYNLSQLPLHINNFPWGGGVNDVVKVCFLTGGAATCCRTIAVAAPNCLGTCHIFDLSVQVGDCNPAGGYHVNVNFGVTNPGNDLFEVWANNQYLGAFPLNQLPLHIPNFPASGNPFDVIRVCIKDHPDCCVVKEIQAPVCDPCEIVNLHVDTGDCNADSTYHLTLNFGVANSTATEFVVWGNGVLIGVFNLNQLPLHIAHFPWDGTGPNDVIKVCIGGNTGANTCCRILEFPIPSCLYSQGCAITGLVVDPGDCTSDSTYNLFVNFQVSNPPGNVFGVWANDIFQGMFELSQLPLNFIHFPWSGGTHDVVKVCFLNAGSAACCRTVEFLAPACLGSSHDCHITDVHGVRTACLCGQFFVALTFNHVNGGSGGFDVVGNGNQYGTYPYNTQQPIILGPFPGDGTTVYEFGVVDHLHPDCHDGFVLGSVMCASPITEVGGKASSLVLSPNPASNWLNVTAMLENGTDVGQATVKVYHADGRLVQTQEVPNAASFMMDISNLPGGVYRLSVQAGSGRLEGSFTKQ